MDLEWIVHKFVTPTTNGKFKTENPKIVRFNNNIKTKTGDKPANRDAGPLHLF